MSRFRARRPGQRRDQQRQPGAAMAMSQAAPSLVAAGQLDHGQPGDQAEFVAPVPQPGERPGPRDGAEAASTLAMTLGSFGRRGRPDAIASSPP